MSTFLADETGNHITEELALQVNRIYERAQHEALALLQSRPTEKVVVPVREWMSATQLAEYWQLYNDKNEPTTAGILKWSKRPISLGTGVRKHTELLKLKIENVNFSNLSVFRPANGETLK